MPIVKILSSATPGHAPSALVAGQIALNSADGKLFWLDADGHTVRSFNFKKPQADVSDTIPFLDYSSLLATTSWVIDTMNYVINGGGDPPPTNLNSISELALAVNSDPNFGRTVNNVLATCLRFDVPQSLSAAQKTQVSANIGIGSSLRFDIAQTLTAPQLVQVYSNLGGVSPNCIRYDVPQTLTSGQQAQAQANLGNSAWSTGDCKTTFKTAADAGWVLANDGSIGDASSGATTRANADTAALFALLYAVTADADAPIQTSSGAGTTRAVQGSAAAAYAAHCRLVMPKTLGRALGVAGAGATLTARPLGSSLGAESHTLTTAELPHLSYTATYRYNTGGGVSGSTPYLCEISENDHAGDGGWALMATTQNASSNNTVVTVSDSNGGGAHSVMNPTTYINLMVKL